MVWWGAGRSVLFVKSCKPLDGEAVGNTDERRPDPAMDKCDSALDQASCNYLVRGAKTVENGEDFMSGCVAPPAPADRLPCDLLCEIRVPVREQTAAQPPARTPKPTDPPSRIQPPAQRQHHDP